MVRQFDFTQRWHAPSTAWAAHGRAEPGKHGLYPKAKRGGNSIYGNENSHRGDKLNRATGKMGYHRTRTQRWRARSRRRATRTEYISGRTCGAGVLGAIIFRCAYCSFCDAGMPWLYPLDERLYL